MLQHDDRQTRKKANDVEEEEVRPAPNLVPDDLSEQEIERLLRIMEGTTSGLPRRDQAKSQP